jgi:hypothetical protein
LTKGSLWAIFVGSKQLSNDVKIKTMRDHQIISQMEKGNDIAQSDLQKIAGKIVRFFKKKGFPDVSQDTRKGLHRYISIRVKGEVPAETFREASEICPATKTYVIPPDGTNRTNYYSYFYV